MKLGSDQRVLHAAAVLNTSSKSAAVRTVHCQHACIAKTAVLLGVFIRITLI
jgi:hypothetical protein